MLVFEAVVKQEDVVPARAALEDGDFMWVSADEYSTMASDISEVRLAHSHCSLLPFTSQAPFGEAPCVAGFYCSSVYSGCCQLACVRCVDETCTLSM